MIISPEELPVTDKGKQVGEAPVEDHRGETSTETSNNDATIYKEDKYAWIVSIILLLLVLAFMWVWGNSLNWSAQSGYGYTNENGTGRFDPEPFGCNDTSHYGRHGLDDCTGSWYFWKLPSDETNALTTAVVWILYSTHQLFVWALIYKAQLEMSPENRQKRKETGSKYDHNMRWYNYALLIVNGLFHILHLIQTHWTYDGISQDVAVSSSQASVILMISVIMLIEYRERGFIFMWPTLLSDDKFAQKLRLNPQPTNYVRKYHGYYFSWAIIYTFWYHPMENTWGHTSGFFHTGIVMIQGSLIFTDMHLNKYWRLLNESWVTVHGFIVAVQTANPDKPNSSWPRFLFGFGFLLCFTQIFNLPIWKRISPWFRILPGAIFYVVVTIIYVTIIPGGLSKIWETITIPLVIYGNTLLVWFILYILIDVEKYFTCDSCYGAPSRGSNILYVVAILFLYSMMIFGSFYFNYAKVMFVILMEVYVVSFMVLFTITIMLHKRIFGPFRRKPVVDVSNHHM